MKKLTQFFRDERGITAIEYGLIAGVLALGILSSVTGVAKDLSATFQSISTALQTKSASS
jgi:pilus assembly protein Flp/PilA